MDSLSSLSQLSKTKGGRCFDASGYITDAINDRVKVLNAMGRRVVNISFPKVYYGNTVMVCLFWEEEEEE